MSVEDRLRTAIIAMLQTATPEARLQIAMDALRIEPDDEDYSMKLYPMPDPDGEPTQ